MLVWFLILVATVFLIGQLCGSQRDWDFMRADIQNIVQNVQTTPLVTWNPTKPIPPMPVPPPGLLNSLTLQRDLFTPETYTALQSTIRMYQDFSDMSALWRQLWLTEDRENLIASSELFIEHLRAHMEENPSE
ncbi:hypothetical protein CRM22_010760, partial [Opisthorchis felineus]